ncbi:hypothetical protein DFP93_11625 [Aneurinibacillus soli]|uniref:Uncharacterized protein n=1 Tax=Aneurinibacillus soli TaxID=1500254 RepID=A0A0U5BF66_9BACL|nr:hypothetical protein DFP93_11625 [Aneurinibacillus soli]BAU29341.1 hypothetical protein CB4_03528 [Aneurinibacillus soli]
MEDGHSRRKNKNLSQYPVTRKSHVPYAVTRFSCFNSRPFSSVEWVYLSVFI